MSSFQRQQVFRFTSDKVSCSRDCRPWKSCPCWHGWTLTHQWQRCCTWLHWRSWLDRGKVLRFETCRRKVLQNRRLGSNDARKSMGRSLWSWKKSGLGIFGSRRFPGQGEGPSDRTSRDWRGSKTGESDGWGNNCPGEGGEFSGFCDTWNGGCHETSSSSRRKFAEVHGASYHPGPSRVALDHQWQGRPQSTGRVFGFEGTSKPKGP